MNRLAWHLVGWSAQAAFGLLCLSLMWFLQLSTPEAEAQPWSWGRLAVDLALVIGFAVPHSVLLLPPVRRLLARIMPAQLAGSLFCWVSCLSLWALMLLWQPSGGVVWRTGGAGTQAMLAAAGAVWLLLGYSMHLAGFGWQTGFTPFLAWVRGRPDPPRPFQRRSLHRWLRHPIYLSFLAVTWLVPVMTADRLLLAIGFSAYCYAGSWAKDRRLLRLVGDGYRRYMEEVPGFPLIGLGLLGRARPAA